VLIQLYLKYGLKPVSFFSTIILRRNVARETSAGPIRLITSGGRTANDHRILPKLSKVYFETSELALSGLRECFVGSTVSQNLLNFPVFSTALGTVASEIAGERVLQPNSPSSMVTSALSSANKTRHLARRLYFSFVPKQCDGSLRIDDVARFFPSYEQAAAVSCNTCALRPYLADA
jgi:hypothetical protein